MVNQSLSIISYPSRKGNIIEQYALRSIKFKYLVAEEDFVIRSTLKSPNTIHVWFCSH